jgi:hypothetical protein
MQYKRRVYCPNNPTLYAIADAIMALKIRPENIRVVSVGVGVYPARKTSLVQHDPMDTASAERPASAEDA